MRVISGIARGRMLKSVKGQKTRPTLDRVKEAIFNVLSVKIPGCIFLDLFSGTGSIGIEAISRGAELVYFNDNSIEAINVIKENLATLNFNQKAKISKASGENLLIKFTQEKKKFTIIYLDPPYASDMVENCLAIISENDLILEKGVVVVETSSKNELPQVINRLTQVKTNTYGDTKISYWQYNL